MKKWDLPAGWGWLPISTIAEKTHSRPPAQDETFMYVDISAVDNAKGVIVDGRVKPYHGAEAPSRARKVIHQGDVIFATTRPSLRNIAIVPEKYEGQICSTGFCVLSPKEGLGVADFIFYAVRSSFFIDQLIPQQRGASYPAVTDGDVFATAIPIPHPDDPERSCAEQRKIAARLKGLLDEVVEMQTLQKEIEDDMAQLMDSVLADVFAENKQQGWEHQETMGSLVKMTALQVDPTDPAYRSLPHINGECIQGGSGRLLPYRTAEQDGVISNKYYFQPGSVLYSKIRPYLRKAALVDFAGVCSADVYPLQVLREDLAPQFLKWSLLAPSFTEYVVDLSRRARIPKVNSTQLSGYRLRFPSKEEQLQISAHLDNVLDEIVGMTETNGANSVALKQLEQSVLAQAFRGEL